MRLIPLLGTTENVAELIFTEAVCDLRIIELRSEIYYPLFQSAPMLVKLPAL